MTKGLLTVLFIPVLLVWSLIYGVLGGMVFKIMAVVEHWVSINRHALILWKRYPYRSYNKFTSAILASRMKRRPLELINPTRIQIRAQYSNQPFPAIALVSNTLLMIVTTPYHILIGAVKGPAFVFSQTLQWWKASQ